jgi:hypothetical protein
MSCVNVMLQRAQNGFRSYDNVVITVDAVGIEWGVVASMRRRASLVLTKGKKYVR